MSNESKSIYEIAYSYYQKQDFETAIEFFEKVVNKDDLSEDAVERLKRVEGNVK